MRHVKYLFSTLVLLLCSATASAYDFEVDGIYYNITSKEDLTVEVGNRDGFSDSYFGTVAIPSNVTYEEVEYSVTRIGASAFSNCRSLTSITIPESVTSIESSAFYGCSSLTSITIPESVTSIGASAFFNTAWYDNQPDGVIYINKVLYGYKGTMPANTSVEVKEGITFISPRAFYRCSSLTSITIPEGVTSIESDTFNGCSSLTSITLPESLTSIGSNAFKECYALTSITIPEGVTSVGDMAFDDTKWFKNQADGVLYVGKVLYRYKGAMLETSFEVKEGTTEISGSAFYGCSSLTSISIPESVTRIGTSAFYYCSSLTSITIPEGVTSIGREAFRDCLNLTSVTIPESVTSIEDWAFSSCI